MPTYEYACASCHHEWEFEQSIKAASLTDCPSCHQQTARRQISKGGGFILKGSGWYSDLYSSSSNKPAAPADSSSSSPDAKPATDSGSKSEKSEKSEKSSEKSEGGGAGTSSSSPAAAGSSSAAA
jgi:putative FmdB family regulatory protein